MGYGFHLRVTHANVGPLRHSLPGARFLPVTGGARFVSFILMVGTDDNRANSDVCDMSERCGLHGFGSTCNHSRRPRDTEPAPGRGQSVARTVHQWGQGRFELARK